MNDIISRAAAADMAESAIMHHRLVRTEVSLILARAFIVFELLITNLQPVNYRQF